MAVPPLLGQLQPVVIKPVVGPSSWMAVAMVTCLTLTTMCGGAIAFLIYLRPVIKAAQRAAEAAEAAAEEMETAAKVWWGTVEGASVGGQAPLPDGRPAAKESNHPQQLPFTPPTGLPAWLQAMEKTALMFQEDMPLTLSDMQRTAKEFEVGLT